MKEPLLGAGILTFGGIALVLMLRWMDRVEARLTALEKKDDTP